MSVIDVIIDQGIHGFTKLEHETKFMFWVALSETFTRSELKKYYNRFIESGVLDTGITNEVVKNTVTSLQIRYETGLGRNGRSLEDYQSSDSLHCLVKYLLIGMIKLQDPTTLFEKALSDAIKSDQQE